MTNETHDKHVGGSHRRLSHTCDILAPLMIDVVSLAADLISIESTRGAEGPIVEFVTRWLVSRGWSLSFQELSRGRANIWASRAGGGVTLSTHLDTVQPHRPPHIERGKLFGRGACDAKGSAAAMLCAADQLAKSGEHRVDMLFVVGQETGSDGARAANRLPATSKYLVNGGPTGGVLASWAKGSLRVTLRTHGHAAHSAYPHLGTSAIEPMLDLLASVKKLELPRDPVLGDTTVNVGTLRGGTAGNTVPAMAESELMIQLVGGVEPIKAAVNSWADGHADVEYGSHIPPQRFHIVPGFKNAAVAFTSDIPLLDRWGIPLLVGPGSMLVAHTPDEFIEVDELRQSVGFYERLTRQLLQE